MSEVKETKEVATPSTFRVTDKVKNDLKGIAEQNHWSQDETFSQLIGMYEIEQAKVMIPGRRVEIETFQTHLQKLSDIFRAGLQLNQDAEERIKSGYETTLVSNQKTIADLQEQKENDKLTIQEDKNTITDLVNRLETALKDYNGLESEMTKTESLCQEYKEKNDTLNGLLTEYNEDRAKQKELKKQMEQLESQNQTILNQMAEKERSLRDKEESILSLKKQMEQLEKQNQKDIQALEEQNEKDKQLLDQQAESSLKMAVLNTREEYNTIIEELKNNANKEYRELLEQLEELRKENHQLEKSLLQKPASTRAKKKVEENKE